MEEKELTFNQKFLKLINELKAPKNQQNTFGKYKYRSAEDILEAVKPLANSYGLVPNLSDELVLIGERYYIKATASITDGEQTYWSTGFAREEETKKGMDGSQITGTASSYARKYAMNGLYQIDDTKDADTDEFKQQENKQTNQKSNNASGKQVGMIKAKILEYSKLANGDKDKLETFYLDKYGVSSFDQLNNQSASEVINGLTKKISEKA